jgi:non-homologous end joining protein Ku
MAAARRAYWKGYLKLSLVTCPIALYPVSSQAEKTHFHQINRKTGHGLHRQMVDEVTGTLREMPRESARTHPASDHEPRKKYVGMPEG